MTCASVGRLECVESEDITWHMGSDSVAAGDSRTAVIAEENAHSRNARADCEILDR